MLSEERKESDQVQSVPAEDDDSKEDTEKSEDSDEDEEDDNDESEEDEDDNDIERKLNEQLLEDIRRARAQTAAQRSPKEEAALATIKTVLAFAASDVLVRETLASAPVPGHPDSNVLAMLNKIMEEGHVSAQVAGPLSYVLVKLAKSEVLFSPLPPLPSQTLKRKRDEGEDVSTPPDKRSSAEVTVQTEHTPNASAAA